jgi:uncharacterized protein YndB with AHSA1/START domain
MQQEQPMGTLLRNGDRLGVRYERQLAHPPAKVWRAITESEHLRQWMPCDIVGERREGAAIELPFWPDHVAKYGLEESLTGTIRIWDPRRVFEWTWDRDLLRWELTPARGGTLLVFTTWLGEPDAEGAWQTAAGYHICLDQLIELLDTGSVAVRLIDRETTAWEARYEEALGQLGAASSS